MTYKVIKFVFLDLCYFAKTWLICMLYMINIQTRQIKQNRHP